MEGVLLGVCSPFTIFPWKQKEEEVEPVDFANGVLKWVSKPVVSVQIMDDIDWEGVDSGSKRYRFCHKLLAKEKFNLSQSVVSGVAGPHCGKNFPMDQMYWSNEFFLIGDTLKNISLACRCLENIWRKITGSSIIHRSWEIWSQLKNFLHCFQYLVYLL